MVGIESLLHTQGMANIEELSSKRNQSRRDTF